MKLKSIQLGIQNEVLIIRGGGVNIGNIISSFCGEQHSGLRRGQTRELMQCFDNGNKCGKYYKDGKYYKVVNTIQIKFWFNCTMIENVQQIGWKFSQRFLNEYLWGDLLLVIQIKNDC